MDICKKRIYAVLITCLSLVHVAAQDYRANIYLDSNTKQVLVNFESASKNLPEYLYFPYNYDNKYILSDQEVKTIYQDTIEEMREFEMGKDFQLRPHTRFLSINFDLNSSKNVPTNLWINYGDIDLLNLKEILFITDDNYSIELNVITHKKTIQKLGIKTFDEWIENPLELQKPTLFMSYKNIDFYTNTPNNKLKELIEITLKNFVYLEGGEKKKVYLINDNKDLQTGGNTFKNAAIVYIDSKTNGSDPNLAMQRTLLHELFHWVSPYHIHPMAESYQIDKNWLSEATPEYLSLYYLLNNQLISDKEFLAIIEEKMREALAFSNKSLFDMSIDVYHHPAYYKAFYSKGTIAVFMLDLKIHLVSQGKLNVMNVILGNYPELDGETQLALNNLLNDMEEKMVVSGTAYSYNEFLQDYGLIYEKRVVLPMNENDKQAQVKHENIIFNKMATLEQKSRWERFINQ